VSLLALHDGSFGQVFDAIEVLSFMPIPEQQAREVIDA
jgi:hypothetical protein